MLFLPAEKESGQSIFTLTASDSDRLTQRSYPVHTPWVGVYAEYSMRTLNIARISSFYALVVRKRRNPPIPATSRANKMAILA